MGFDKLFSLLSFTVRVERSHTVMQALILVVQAFHRL